MIVIADASPLNCLILIDQVDLLHTIYKQILIPEAVLEELKRPATPPKVRKWLQSPPSWLEVHTVTRGSDEGLDALDAGEREAILLALELSADTVLIDQTHGRREAVRHRIHVVGTLSVLEQAANRGLIDFPAALARLEQTNFRLTPKLRAAFLARIPKKD